MEVYVQMNYLLQGSTAQLEKKGGGCFNSNKPYLSVADSLCDSDVLLREAGEACHHEKKKNVK